jgi:hypothetical protein
VLRVKPGIRPGRNPVRFCRVPGPGFLWPHPVFAGPGCTRGRFSGVPGAWPAQQRPARRFPFAGIARIRCLGSLSGRSLSLSAFPPAWLPGQTPVRSRTVRLPRSSRRQFHCHRLRSSPSKGPTSCLQRTLVPSCSPWPPNASADLEIILGLRHPRPQNVRTRRWHRSQLVRAMRG